jgi:hypothetical protein
MKQTEPKELALAKVHGPNSRRVLEYSYVMKGILDDAKKPGFTDDQWAPLADLVDIAKFERVGNFLETVHWDDQYVPLLSQWAKATDWNFTIRRLTEGPNYAVQEMHEYAQYPDRYEEYNSVTVFEFDAAGKLVHLDVYLQMAMPPTASQAHQWDLEKVGAQV